MKWRLFKRVGLGHGLNANVGKRGLGFSFRLPGAPASIGISTQGKPYASAGLPGSGLYVRHDLTTNHVTHQGPQAVGQKVYFVTCNEFVKIGVSENPPDRIGELQVGCPYELRLLATAIGGYRFEKWLHETFDHLHVRGEWFLLDPKLLAIIEKYGQFTETGKQ